MHESEVAQSCPTLGDPMDCSPPGSSAHGIFQARADMTERLSTAQHNLYNIVCQLSIKISWEIDGETVETVVDFIFLGSQITADGDCSHEIKRRLLLGRKVMHVMGHQVPQAAAGLITWALVMQAPCGPVGT